MARAVSPIQLLATESNSIDWLEGVLLMALYVIIAVAAWFFPGETKISACATK
jgi:hypothetical protein